MIKYTKILFVFVVIFFSSCGSVTDITGYWSEEPYMGKQYKNIAVLAITNNIENRKIG